MVVFLKYISTQRLRVLTKGVLMMLLDDRKMRILRAIVDDYINTAEPVGSRTIARKHELGLSSATIRNEMADLEEMGYLSQPHTSAGRVPSDKGYRFYVDQLMEVRQLSLAEMESIRSAMEVRINELSQLIRQAASVISQLTKYTSVAVTSHKKKSSVKTVQVVLVESGKALVTVVSNTGIIRNELIRISDSITADMLIRMSNMMNEKVNGLKVDSIDKGLIKEALLLTGLPDDTLAPIYTGVNNCIRQIESPNVYHEGAINIFNFPEFRDVVKAREFLHILDEKEMLVNLLNDENTGKDKITIRIGTENEIEEIKDCSVISATFSVDGMELGSIGILGPTRMEYPRVVSSMRYIQKQINKEISKLIGESDGDKD